jgi:Glycosyltransferase family 87
MPAPDLEARSLGVCGVTSPARVAHAAFSRAGRAGWVAVGLVAAGCVVIPGGLLSSGWGGDVFYYRQIGQRIADGLIPYHEFYLEYPPGSTVAFAAPSFLSQAHYFLVFKLLMTLCAVVAAAAGMAVTRRAGAPARAQIRAAVALGLAPLALGPLFLNRYDLWPAAVLSVALLALVAGRPRLAFALLALAVVAKIYALAVVPVAVIHVLRRRGRDELVRALAVFLGVGLVLVVPFAVTGFGGLGYSFYIQATRQLQVESLGAQLLVAAGHLGAYHPVSVIGAPGSRNLAGPAADAVGFASSFVEVVAVALVARWYWRGKNDPQRLVLAFATAVAAFVAFGKVLSPQYVVWLIPLVPLVDAGIGLAASLLFGVTLLITQVAFYDSDRVASLGTVSWLVLVRDLGLVVLFGILARRLTREAPA